MSKGASLTNSLLMFFRKYSLRDSSDNSSGEGMELLFIEGSWGDDGIDCSLCCRGNLSLLCSSGAAYDP
jgi:hypothetical protein